MLSEHHLVSCTCALCSSPSRPLPKAPMRQLRCAHLSGCFGPFFFGGFSSSPSSASSATSSGCSCCGGDTNRRACATNMNTKQGAARQQSECMEFLAAAAAAVGVPATGRCYHLASPAQDQYSLQAHAVNITPSPASCHRGVYDTHAFQLQDWLDAGQECGCRTLTHECLSRTARTCSVFTFLKPLLPKLDMVSTMVRASGGSSGIVKCTCRPVQQQLSKGAKARKRPAACGFVIGNTVCG